MRPTSRLLAVALAWCLLAVASATLQWGTPALGILAGVVVCVAIWDLVSLGRRATLAVTRRLPEALSLGDPAEVHLTVLGAHSEAIRVFDSVPSGLAHAGLPARVLLVAARRTQLTYEVRPMRRGTARFDPPHVERRSPWRLFAVVDRPGESQEVRVYPSFRRVAHYAQLALGQRARSLGSHLQRQRGQGLEFHQLREFREGDSLSQVDWRSVARRQMLISREYREEQNQRVVFALDCGRRMRAADGDHTLFDQALNALLLLSHVALRQGDAVGLLTFSGLGRRFQPPVRGPGGLSRLLEGVYDLDSSGAPSDYFEAAYHLMVRQRRRSLIVLLTNLGDDDSSELAEALAPLCRKHVVLVASIRDPALREPFEVELRTADDALTAMSASAYLGARRGTREILHARGLRSLDVEPTELPGSLVRQYMQIKRAGLL